MNFQAKTKHLKDLDIKFVGNVIIEKTYRKRVIIYQKYQKLRSIEPWWKYVRIQTVFLFPLNWFTRENYQNWITNFVKSIWIHFTHVHMCINYFLWAYDYVSSFWINAQQRLPMPSSRAFPTESKNTHQRHELRQLFELIFFKLKIYIFL